MNKKFLILIIFIIISCSKEDDLPSLVQEEIENLPPLNFSIGMSEITDNSAKLKWTESKDPEEKEVSYELWLNGVLLESKFLELNYELQDLTELTEYFGEIVAIDPEGNENRESYSFRTEKFYQKFLKRLDYQYYDGYFRGGNPYSLIKADGENFVIAGKTPFGYNGNQFFVIKIDKNGDEIWKKLYPYQVGDHGILR